MLEKYKFHWYYYENSCKNIIIIKDLVYNEVYLPKKRATIMQDFIVTAI